MDIVEMDSERILERHYFIVTLAWSPSDLFQRCILIPRKCHVPKKPYFNTQGGGGCQGKLLTSFVDEPSWKTLRYDLYSEINGIWHIFSSVSRGIPNFRSALWGSHPSLTKVIFKHLQDQFLYGFCIKVTRFSRISFDFLKLRSIYISTPLFNLQKKFWS